MGEFDRVDEFGSDGVGNPTSKSSGLPVDTESAGAAGDVVTLDDALTDYKWLRRMMTAMGARGPVVWRGL